MNYVIILMDVKKRIVIDVKIFFKIGIEWYFFNIIRIYLKVG